MYLTRSFAVLLCFSLLCSSPFAADIYRWVDDQGRTQLSDSVPDEYKKSAIRIDSRQFEVTSGQRREAEARAAQERARAKATKDEKALAASKANSQAGSGISATRGTPTSSANTGNDCETQYRLYRESLACFAPYVNVNGSVKVEAFERCKPVLDPSQRCGPPKSEENTSRTYVNP